MADAFFLHQFIMKQDVDLACTAHFSRLSSASTLFYMIIMNAILELQVSEDEEASDIYATQPPSFKDVFGMPVHSIIDGTEIPMESSLNKSTRASTYSQHKGKTSP